MLQELVYPAAEIPEHLKCQVVSFLRLTWPEGFVGENRLRDWISRPENHSVSILLVEGGLLISHTEVVWKMLPHNGETYKAYGLSGVLTYPSFRGQGYGARVVALGTAMIAASDADIGMFHCDFTLKDFYARHGWIPMESAVTLVGNPAQPRVCTEELLMMRFFSAHGQRSRRAFETLPFYFGEDTW